MKTFLTATAIAAVLASGGAAFAADSLASGGAALNGRWDAVLTRDGAEIPFRLDIKGDGPTLEGVFYNGFEAYDGTTSARYENGKLVLNIEHYLTTINAKLEGDKLVGDVAAQSRESNANFGFRAVRHVDTPKPTAAQTAPSIAGNWIIPLATPSAKGEKAFHFVVEQRGQEAAASILRIDGDTGAYTGAYKDGKWVLSHFDGGRPGVITVTPKADGTLEVLQRAERAERAEAKPAAAAASEYGTDAALSGRYANALVAYRPDVAQAKGFAKPDDFLTHTTARDPNEVFKFSFPDENGKIVSSTDARFKDKVIVAVVTGTWCPNCHDEAQYLVELDKQYRDKGLEIVALNFEEPGQHAELKRQKAFVKKYGVKYSYLLAGAPAEMWEKVPQLNHLDTWPATLFIGRDGKIKAVHSGFASPSAGEFHTNLKKDFTSRVEKLLAEKPVVAEAKPVAVASN